MPNELLGSLSALVASFAWGVGDFSGGYASRRDHPYQVLTLSALIGLLPLLFLVVLANEGWPSGRSLLLGGVAGLAGTLGLAVFYRGLMEGQSAVVAPVASVIGAMVPMVIGISQAGFPSNQRIIGFVLGLIGIWLVSQEKPVGEQAKTSGLRYGVLAGIGFGAFLSLIAQVEADEIYGPLIASKMGGLIYSYWFIRKNALPVPSVRKNWPAALAGLMDTMGNIFYLLGTQLSRLDVVAALSSLYPAGPVLLGRFLLKEHVSQRQWVGVVVSISAVILITT